MITKITKGNGFRGLAAYLTRQGASARVIGVENLPSSNPGQASRIMRQTAKLSARCKKPVLHFSLRPAPGDRFLTDDEFLQAGQKLLSAFGMTGNQALFVTHEGGTSRQHLHVMSNRIDPETGRAAALNNDRRIAKKVAAEIEKEFGLQLAVQNDRQERVGQDTQREAKERQRKGRTATDAHKEAARAAYERAGGSKAAFSRLLMEQGFVLAQGDRRGIIIVDGYGRVCSFSRALTKQQRDQLGIERGRLSLRSDAVPELKQASKNVMKEPAKAPLVPPVEELSGPGRNSQIEWAKKAKARKQRKRIRRTARGAVRFVQAVTDELQID